MTRDEFIANLEACRTAMVRRSIFMIVVLIVGSSLVIGAGLSLFHYYLMPGLLTALLVIFIVFLLGTLGLFLPVVYYWPLKKYELLCPHCGKSILESDPQWLLREGVCNECGGRFLELIDPTAPVYPEKGEPAEES